MSEGEAKGWAIYAVRTMLRQTDRDMEGAAQVAAIAQALSEQAAEAEGAGLRSHAQSYSAAAKVIYGATTTRSEPLFAESNYFARHWRGELSLAISFWINLVIINIALLAASAAISAGYVQHLVSYGALMLFLRASAIVHLWQFVGCWRAATDYGKKRPKIWEAAAKIAVMIGVSQFVIQTLNL